MKTSRKKNKSLWIAIGAAFLIILLIAWLTMAEFAGDTDVAACISPLAMINVLAVIR